MSCECLPHRNGELMKITEVRAHPFLFPRKGLWTAQEPAESLALILVEVLTMRGSLLRRNQGLPLKRLADGRALGDHPRRRSAPARDHRAKSSSHVPRPRAMFGADGWPPVPLSSGRRSWRRRRDRPRALGLKGGRWASGVFAPRGERGRSLPMPRRYYPRDATIKSVPKSAQSFRGRGFSVR